LPVSGFVHIVRLVCIFEVLKSSFDMTTSDVSSGKWDEEDSEIEINAH
jgi:hypothetical protein